MHFKRQNFTDEQTAHGTLKKVIVRHGLVPSVTQIAIAELPPGAVVEFHSHPTMYETFFALEGCARYYVGDAEYMVRAGDLVIVPPATTHSISAETLHRVFYWGMATDEQPCPQSAGPAAREGDEAVCEAGGTRVIAVVPCRAGSERIFRKNTKPFAGVHGGLLRIKLEQLACCPSISSMLVSTDDPEAAWIAKVVEQRFGKCVRVEERPSDLAVSSTTTDALISHIGDLLRDEAPDTIVLWTHVTSPFFYSHAYARLLGEYARRLREGFDSLVAGQRMTTFLWGPAGPINFRGEAVRWPRTQDLAPVWAVTNAAFVAPLRTYWELGDRIGKRPYWFECNALESVDVDWPADFELAERLWLALCGSLSGANGKS